jgi:hypothetical protein
MTIFNSILHVVPVKKIITNFSQSEAFMAPGSHVVLTDRNESNNTWLDHANEHSYHVSSHLLQWFSRRRLKCIRTDDRRNVMAIARVRWAKKGCTRLPAASDKAYQLLALGRWFSPGTLASSTTKTGRHDIAEILLKVALNTKIQIPIARRLIVLLKLTDLSKIS